LAFCSIGDPEADTKTESWIVDAGESAHTMVVPGNANVFGARFAGRGVILRRPMSGPRWVGLQAFRSRVRM
jgi:hypothetical protein